MSSFTKTILITFGILICVAGLISVALHKEPVYIVDKTIYERVFNECIARANDTTRYDYIVITCNGAAEDIARQEVSSDN